ncbi:MAG: hypothetical protein FJ290_24875 [Planctomycetes bacterium]|nr:hypothetical protein [Planctomycetota bacterium]
MTLFEGKPQREFEKLFAPLAALDPDEILDALVSPLRSYSTLGKKAKHNVPGSSQGCANRHEVLHGADLAYATKANSLRAIILVDYLLGIKRMLDLHRESAAKLHEALEAIGVETTGHLGPGESS